MAAETVCKVEDCDKPANRKGLCNGHYHKLNRYGDPLGGRPKTPDGCSVEGCGEPYYCGGFCTKHYQRHRKHGDPAVVAFKSPAEDWLRANVDFSGSECLTWPFYRKNNGYGEATLDGKKSVASRVMCILAHGEPPTPKHEAAHSCGKGHEGCVNPNHLRWATASENQLEREAHGTSNAGDRHWTKRRRRLGG